MANLPIDFDLAESHVKEARGVFVPETYHGGIIEVTCPFGNIYRIYEAYPGFGFRNGIGILYAQIDCARGTGESIGKYYEESFEAEVSYEPKNQLTRVICGDWNHLIFQEKDDPKPFDGI